MKIIAHTSKQLSILFRRINELHPLLDRTAQINLAYSQVAAMDPQPDWRTLLHTPILGTGLEEPPSMISAALTPEGEAAFTKLRSEMMAALELPAPPRVNLMLKLVLFSYLKHAEMNAVEDACPEPATFPLTDAELFSTLYELLRTDPDAEALCTIREALQSWKGGA